MISEELLAELNDYYGAECPDCGLRRTRNVSTINGYLTCQDCGFPYNNSNET